MSGRRAAIIRLCVLLGIVGGLFLSCATVEITRFVHQVEPYRDGDLTITATFLDQKELTRRYGRLNPFLPPTRRILSPIDFFVVELSVEGPEDMRSIRSQNVELVFGSVRKKPVSTRRLLAIWENEIEVHGSEVVTTNYRRMVRGAIVPINITRGTIGRLLLFQGNFPHGGDALVSIPHPDPDRSQNEVTTQVDATPDEPTKPFFDGKRIHFNFLVSFEEKVKQFRLF